MPPLDDQLLAMLGHLNYMEFGREVTRQTGPGAAVHEEGGVLLYAADTSMPVLLNGVWRTDRRVPGTEVLERADAFFAARRHGYSINVRDGVAEDDDLRAAAGAAGMLELLSAPEMVLRQRLADPSSARDGAAAGSRTRRPTPTSSR